MFTTSDFPTMSMTPHDTQMHRIFTDINSLIGHSPTSPALIGHAPTFLEMNPYRRNAIRRQHQSMSTTSDETEGMYQLQSIERTLCTPFMIRINCTDTVHDGHRVHDMMGFWREGARPSPASPPRSAASVRSVEAQTGMERRSAGGQL